MILLAANKMADEMRARGVDGPGCEWADLAKVVIDVLSEPTREMVRAGLNARRNPKFSWDTDERRLIEEFRAVLQAAITPTR